MDFWDNFWNIIWWVFCASVFFAYLFTLFGVVTDLFSDRGLSGWWKAVWVIFLVFLPFVTVLVYLIARGRGMNERAMERSRSHQQSAEDYIRRVATTSPSDEITKAKDLLDSGTINQEEFDMIKRRAYA